MSLLDIAMFAASRLEVTRYCKAAIRLSAMHSSGQNPALLLLLILHNRVKTQDAYLTHCQDISILAPESL